MKLKFWKKEKKEPKKLTKEEKLSKAISEGIAGGAGIILGEIGKAFMIVLLIIVLFFVGLYAYGEYQENKMCEERGICFDDNDDVIAEEGIVEQLYEYPLVTCSVIDVETGSIINEYGFFHGWQEVINWREYHDRFNNEPSDKDIKVECYEN